MIDMLKTFLTKVPLIDGELLFRVFIPDFYDKSSVFYPVLYLQDE